MDDSLCEKSSETNWRAELARSCDEQRQSARTLLERQRERFRALETQLTSRIDELVATLSSEQIESQQQEQDISRREMLLAQRDSALAERLQELAARETQWSLSLQESQDKQQAWLDQMAQRLAALDERHAELNDLECRLQLQQVACSRREAELERQAQELAERTQKFEQTLEQAGQRQAALDQSREKLREESDQLQRQLEELRQAQAQLERDRAALLDREQETQRQRRHVAQQLRSRKNELVAEIELHRAEALCSSHGEELQLQIRLSELQAKYDRAREELAERDSQQGSLGERVSLLQDQLQAREAELQAINQAAQEAETARREFAEKVESLSADLTEAKEQLAQQHELVAAELSDSFTAKEQSLTAELESARERLDALQAELEQARAEAAAKVSDSQLLEVDLSGEIARLQEENQQLQQQLAEAQANRGASSEGDSEELEDLRNRLEMAVHDVRELKSKNADLTEQLAKAKRAAANAGGGAPASGQALGWEAQKQRLLQELENFDEEDEEQRGEKLKIEQAIRITDETVAEKEREIEELRQLLQNQSDNIGNVAVGAAAIASMLDSDELLRQERESVKNLQGELEEKLRKAEVDISLERAKLARERAELEEKLQALERERTQLAAAYGEGGSDQGGKGGKQPARGRWLARLGIQGDEGKK